LVGDEHLAKAEENISRHQFFQNSFRKNINMKWLKKKTAFERKSVDAVQDL